jgi:penicillin-binding protein 1A
MTDLLQGVVDHGTGRAAALGRPTAGKTGTTTSNKDGWFIGFSSGITTGVWMGRDDNRALPGLAGGRAPARAFHDFMARAVSNRPAEPFVTEAAAPDWQIEQNEEFWYTPPADEPLVDADGNPIDPQPDERLPIETDPPPPPADDPKPPERLDREWLDRAIDRPPPPRRDSPPRRRGDEDEG